MKALRRVGFQLEPELVEKVDQYAAVMHINRTAAVSIIISQYLQQQDIAKSLVTITREMEKQRG